MTTARTRAPERQSGATSLAARGLRAQAAALVACMAISACSGSSSTATPSPSPTPMSLSAPVYGATARDDVGLYTRVLGQGPQVIVLLHGGPGLSLEEMTPFDPLLTPHRQLMSFDQRGAGHTGTPSSGDLGLAAQVDDIDALRQSAHVDHLWLIGQSWGGLLAGAYAAAHPERVAGLALIGAAPPDVEAFNQGQQAFTQRLGQLQRQGLVPSPLPGAAQGSCLPTLSAQLPVYAADPAHPPQQPAGLTCTAGTAAAAYAATIRSPVLSAVANQLATFHGPSLILTGASDPFGPAWPAAWRKLLPQATAVTVADAGHDPILEQPTVVLQAVERLLAPG